jgi:hypothetical protein
MSHPHLRHQSPRFRRWLSCCVTAATVFFATAAHSEPREFMLARGTLTVEVNNPDVEVSMEGDYLEISGVGDQDIRFKVSDHLFQRSPKDNAGGAEQIDDVLTIGDDDRPIVRVIATPTFNPLDEVVAIDPAFRDELLDRARSQAGELVGLRSALDERVWSAVNRAYTTTEAAKLLIAFFRGDGALSGIPMAPDEAKLLRDGLADLRQGRQKQFALVTEIANLDERRPASPLVGTWEIAAIRGAGGIAADALELYEPDPVERRFVATNDTALLLTGAGTWLFQATYPPSEPGTIDLSAMMRGNTVYHGRFEANKESATLRLSPMNTARPDSPNGDPADGGFVLELKRIKSG